MGIISFLSLGETCPKCREKKLVCVGHSSDKKKGSFFHFECQKCGHSEDWKQGEWNLLPPGKY